MTDDPKAAFSVLSMGWGVQTWALAAMMALDEHPRADYIVFADTHHEGQATYDFMEQWTPWLGEHGLNVAVVESERTEATRDAWNASVLIPAFTLEGNASHGQTQRQCTGDWKIAPIRRFIRQEMESRGIKASPGIVESWQGISWDEWQRVRNSDVQYISHVFPLVDRKITRAGCIEWLYRHDLPVPAKSSCTFCPFHSRDAWRRMKREGGTDWQESLMVDAAIRNKRPGRECFVHPARRPLGESVDIPEDFGAYQHEMDIGCEGGYCMV